jgi:cell division protein FtsZ
MTFDIPKKEKSIIKVIGVGGGGGNAVEYMFEQGITGVDFAICNTDRQALEKNPIGVKIGLGPALTDGRGAGSRPEIGKQACIESIEEIKAFLEDSTKMLFITAGMGGGTGTGAAPVIAKVAKELDILTVGIVTLPFKFEGMVRQRQGLEGLEEMKKYVDAILVISNERLMTIYGDLKLSDAFSNANEILSTAAKGIAEIITVPGIVNVDFEDVNTVMRESGVALMGFAEYSGENRAKNTIHDALNSPLLKDSDIRGAQNILLNISTSSEHEITMLEFSEITEYVQEEAGRGTNMIWGHCIDDSCGDRMRITLIATGFMEENKNITKPKSSKVVVSLDEEMEELDGFSITQSTESSNTVEFEDFSFTHRHEEPARREEPAPVRSRQVEPASTLYKSTTAEPRDLRSLDDPKTIQEYEKRPAYDRLNISLDDVSESSASQDFKNVISIDDDSYPSLNRENSYINKKQD